MSNKSLILAILILGVTAAAAAPPTQWQEHWFGHEQNISLVYQDTDIAVYFDIDVDRNITWPFQYLSDVWRYTKKTYGIFGPESELYAIFHTGKYSGGHPATYFDQHHDYKNAIDCGSTALDAWVTGKGNDLDIVTHEVSHIVEIASKGTLRSPAFPLWGDSKWAEIFNYDVYRGLNMTEDVKRWYDLMITGSENFPAPNSFWFRDWFYPIYTNYGESAVLNNFFVVLSDNFSKDWDLIYARDLTWGEFIHFWSGAAGKNLKELATNAFGWPEEWETQFNQARSDFPNVQYSQ